MPDLDFEKITLNAIPDGEMPVFHASQFETIRPFIADLKWGSEVFTPGEGCWCTLSIRKTDDTLVIIDDIDIVTNTVSCVLTQQSVACIGDNLCQLKVWSTEDDEDKCIACLNFILHVQPDPEAGGIMSESEINNLTEQIEEITQQVIGDDYYNKTEVDGLLAGKADQATTYTKLEVDTALNLKADKSDTYTKTQTDNLLNDKADKSDTYTKTQVDSALALKANSADLATVATTGDYDDLLNKPVLPDMTQYYTKSEVDALIDGIYPTFTASGPITSFTTALTKPLVSVTADPLATILTCCGINLWDEEWELGYYNTANGQPLPISDRIRSKNFIPIKPETAFRLVITSSHYIMPLFYDKDKNYLGYIANGVYSGYQNPFTSLANACYMTFYVSPSYGTTYNNDISINYPSTDTAYHAYNGTTVSVADATTLVTQSGVNNVFADVGDVTVQYKYMSM